MARVCVVSGKKTAVGNNVSHANNKSRRRYMLNLQQASFFSEALDRIISLRLTTHGMRTIEHKGGVDAFLEKASRSSLTPQLLRLKKQVIQAKILKGSVLG